MQFEGWHTYIYGASPVADFRLEEDDIKGGKEGEAGGRMGGGGDVV